MVVGQMDGSVGTYRTGMLVFFATGSRATLVWVGSTSMVTLPV